MLAELVSGEMNEPMTAKVDRLESELLKMPQAKIVTTHCFLPGVYERTITIPPWTVLTGAPHKTAYEVRLEKGKIAVNTDDGIKTMTAPCSFSAPAGVKRVGRVFDDEVVWTDVYANPDDCRDLGVLEGRLYDLEGCELGDNRLARLAAREREDYRLFLSQAGLTEQTVWEIASNEADLIAMPSGFCVEVRDSRIHGRGLFATRDFKAGELIAPGRIDGKRTPAGRFTNHSSSPNATTHKSESGDLSAVATRPIQQNEEIVIDYRNSMRVNFGIAVEGETPCLDG